MKLKLENHDAATVLLVTETIEASHLPVLKAGLTKLFQSGKKSILLDFTQVTEKNFQDASLFDQIAELRHWAAASDAQLVVISPIEKLGHAKTREQGVQLLSSPLAQLQGLEAKLQAKLKDLEQKKGALSQRLQQSGAEGDLRQLSQQNSLLKKSIAEAERISKLFLKRRTKESYKAPAAEINQENLHKLVDSFLQQEGLLK